MFNLPSKVIQPDPLLAKLNWLQKGCTREKFIPGCFLQCEIQLTHFSVFSFKLKSNDTQQSFLLLGEIPQQSELGPALPGTVRQRRFIHLLLPQSWQKPLVLFSSSILPCCVRGSLATSVIASTVKHSNLTAEISCVPVLVHLCFFHY